MKGYGCFMSSVSARRKGSCPAGHSLSCIHEFVEIVGSSDRALTWTLGREHLAAHQSGVTGPAQRRLHVANFAHITARGDEREQIRQHE